MPDLTEAEARAYAHQWIADYGTSGSHVSQVFAALLAHNAELKRCAERTESLALEATRQTYLREAA